MVRRQAVKRVWGVAVAGLLAAGLPVRGQDAPGNAELLKLIERQNAQIEALTQRVAELEQIKPVLKETMDAYAEQSKAIDKLGSKVGLASHMDGLKFSGDLRARYEYRDQNVGAAKSAAKAEDSSEDRGRLRTRFRLGMVWNSKSEAWELGAGLATGGGDGRSTNDTWNETDIFETGDIRLDYAYAKHKWALMDGQMPLSVTVGQMKNPFVTTFMNWDDDLRPTGVAVQMGDPFGKDFCGSFLTLGAFDVLWGANLNKVNNDTDVLMLAGQAGYAYKSDPFNTLVAAGWRQINSAWEGAVRTATYDPFKTSPGLYAISNGYDVEIADLYGEITTTVSGIGLKAYGHLSMNLGADGAVSQQNLPAGERPDDNDLAWVLGAEAKYSRFTLGYAYGYIGADGVFGPMKDSDFGETAGLMDTDVQGHKLSLSYAVTRNFSLGATGYLLERIEGGSEALAGGAMNDEADQTTCVQVDAVYKF